jgi:hypothetical protein
MRETNDLSKGSGSLYGDGEFLGKIKKSEDGNTVKKSKEKTDALKKSEEDK